MDGRGRPRILNSGNARSRERARADRAASARRQEGTFDAGLGQSGSHGLRIGQRPARQALSAGRRSDQCPGARIASAERRRAAGPRPTTFRQQLADGQDARRPSAARPSPPCAKRPSARSASAISTCSSIGGMVLNEGSIAEMKTGEGKTLVATLPVYLNALAGRGVHVVTVNDYLARRDAEWMGRIYQFLGLSRRRHRARPDARPAPPGLRGRRDLRHQQRVRLRLSARQHGVQPAERWCSAGTTYAIVDEVDSILIDEARTPLIISGPTEDRSELYITIDKLIPQLGAERLRARREGALGDLHRGRHREGRGHPARRRTC